MEKIGILFLLLLVSIIFITSFNKEAGQKNKNEKSKYITVCLDGHIYFERVELKSRSLAIKLDSDGKPIKCN